MGIRRAQARRARVALATMAVRAGDRGISGGSAAGAAAGSAGERRPGGGDQSGAQRERRGPDERRRRRRRAHRGQAGGAVGGLPPDGAAAHKDQIFTRSFASGAWTTRGNGTVGGSSSAAPTFTAR